MTTIEVACAVEGDYVPHSAAMIHSLLANRGDEDLRIHYFHDVDVAASFRDKLAEMVERMGGSIRFATVSDELCEGLPTVGFTRKATWYRIFLADLLPDLDRVICLDVDLIATESLLPLWSTELGGNYLAAVTNVLSDGYMDRPYELGLEQREYFNAGVMVLNLAAMRSDGCSERLRTFGIEHAEELVLRDQDALNAVLAQRRVPLHPRWNCMNGIGRFPWAAYAFTPPEIDEACARPAIRHFEGPDENKPWHYLYTSGHQALYVEHRRQTPWPDIRFAGRTPLRVVRRQLAGLRRRMRRHGGPSGG